ncbi:MAG: cache domain-containing protein [Aliarcobacter sp.]
MSRISQADKNYFFILDYNKTLFHIIDNLIGLPAEKASNLETLRTFDDMVIITKEGFITYKHKNNDNDDSFSTKTSFIKGLDNWQWVIGKGFYQDDVHDILTQRIQLDNEYKKRF